MEIERDLAGLQPGRQRAWWLREALAAEGDAPAAPPLGGTTRADVAILGGGFTGLWTAWFLIEQMPGIRVVVLEQDVCGGGASGRNGGFVTGWWESLPALVRRFGEVPAVAAALEAERAPRAIEAWCRRHDVDAWFRGGGTLVASSAPAQDGAWEPAVALARRLGFGDRIRVLAADEVRARCASPVLRGGALVPGDASIQPARLARGLRRVLLARGVAIHEDTRVRRVRPDRTGGVHVEADHGAISAAHAVVALNAWAAAWREFGSRLITWSSYIVLTEPIPDRLAALGWTGGEAITDSRFTNHYFRTTEDGRIAFGGGGGRAGYGGRIGRWTTDDRGSVRLAVRGFRRIFPMLADVALVDAWGGPIDISPHHLPSFGTVGRGRIHFGHGYSGSGVGPSWLGGRILAALALDRPDDPVAGLPVVDDRPRRFPPEPFRFLGARLIREAIVAAETADDEGREANPLVRALVRVPRTLGYDLGPEATSRR